VTIKVYNTLTRKKEELIPVQSGKVGMYVCGPTVYNFIHIGNARCYVAFDAVVRYLKYEGLNVKYVRNLTDVDDKIIKRAQEEGINSNEIATKYTKAFHKDMETLGCLEPDIEPKATEEIPAMLKIIEGLIEKDFAYEVDGDVFFEITKFEDYGKLSGRTLDEMRAGERVEIDQRKRHPMDFALWKKAKEGEPSWPSPWGAGRPGWHIECSTMSLSRLGTSFDIHGGGQDLIFPHHENEIAQSEAYSGTKPFVRYWMHNGFVTIKAEKMAKSVGNVILIHNLSEEYKGREIELRNALRMLFLSTHYRSPIDFSDEHLEEAKSKVEGLTNIIWKINDLLGKSERFSEDHELTDDEKILNNKIEEAKRNFEQAMDDDFNTPAAIGELFKLEKAANKFIDKHPQKLSFLAKKSLEKAKITIVELSESVLGLAVEEALETKQASMESIAGEKGDLQGLFKKLTDEEIDEGISENQLIDHLVSRREKARKEKDFKKADLIRDKLMEIGIVIEDTPHGPRWKWR